MPILDKLKKTFNASLYGFLVVTVLIGIGAGLGGMTLALLLHAIQHIAYSYSVSSIISQETFLQGVTDATPLRRVWVLALCGLIAGTGWWAIYRFTRPLISINKAVGSSDPRMPVLATTAHAILQIITVALGSPLGREVAPREIGAMLAGWITHRIGLSLEDRRILVACGAGAGLAAVYNVPLGGALFTLEVLLGTFSLSAVIPALITSAIAALVARTTLGDQSQYSVLHLTVSSSLIAWSVVAGPIFGLTAYGFSRLMTTARAQAPRDGRLLIWCVSIFLLIGLCAVPFPELLGNGKGITQMGFDNTLDMKLAASLLLLKVLVTAGSLRAGASGGLLTPALAVGALLAVITGALWNTLCPTVPSAAFAVIGAGAFLASSMRMPITAIALILEFTRVDHDFLIPILFAVSGSILISNYCIRQFDPPLAKCG